VRTLRQHSVPNGTPNSWRVDISPKLSARSISACESLCRSLWHIEAFEEAARMQEKSSLPLNRGWTPWSFSTGYAGAAVTMKLLGGLLESPVLIESAEKYLDAAVASLPFIRHPKVGLFDGLTGLCFAARMVDPELKSTHQMVKHLESRLASMTKERAELVNSSIGMPFGYFDTVSGLSGLGRYWLSSGNSPQAFACVELCADSLSKLIRDSSHANPRWHTPSLLNSDPSLQKRFPQGTLNCGLAHGLAGPVAFLATVLTAGFEDDDFSEALRTGANWLLNAKIQDDYGLNWPTVVPLSNEDNSGVRGARAAWCYGAPGICRALWLAGKALNDETLKMVATDGLCAVHRRPVPLRAISSPTFCHGIAGLLHITMRFANDAPEKDWHTAIEEVLTELLDAQEPDAYLPFRDLEPSGARIERPGLLEGACGIALTLAAATSAVPPIWDAAMLLS